MWWCKNIAKTYTRFSNFKLNLTMDYKEEQKNELEALESIYCGEFELQEAEPCSFTIRVQSLDQDEENDAGLACSLKVTYTPNYPDTLPLIELCDVENLTDSDEEDLMKCIIEYGNENIGMAMVFSLVSAATEWLNSKWDVLKKHQEDEAEKKIRAAEEEERKRFEGTRVTVESFLAWKKLFEDEMFAGKKIVKEKDNKKLTGRELFMLDHTLNESDLKFLEAGEQVAVDESLFQDLDDLGIDDELSDE